MFWWQSFKKLFFSSPTLRTNKLECLYITSQSQPSLKLVTKAIYPRAQH